MALAMQRVDVDQPAAASRGAVTRRFAVGDAVFPRLTLARRARRAAHLLGGVIVSLIIGSMPGVQRTSASAFLSRRPGTRSPTNTARWRRSTARSSPQLIAMLIAVPVGLGIAIFLTELCPPALRRPIGIAIELLAGIPSIIYGIWGLFVFAPFLQQYVQPALIAIFGNVPVLSLVFAGPPYGIGMLTAGMILGDHGAAVRHLDFARRVRDRAAGAEGGRLRHRLHDLGGREQHRHSLYPHRRRRRRACSASAARSARPWR